MSAECCFIQVLCLLCVSKLQLESTEHSNKTTYNCQENFSGTSNNFTDYKHLLDKTLSNIVEEGESVLDRENVNLEDDIKKVCDRMSSLDLLLTEMSQNPPVGGGDDMMTLLSSYNQACADLLYLCSMDKLKVLDMAQIVLERGGSQFFDIEMDKKKIQEHFKWGEDKIDNMEAVIKTTYDYWGELYHINNNFSPGEK